MNQKNRSRLYIALSMLVAFILWTIAIQTVDVRPVGPQGSRVGFATLNILFHQMTGVHMPLYHITDWLGLVPILTAMGFAVLGLVQWIRRKRLRLVDRSIWVLGGFYAAVLAVYVLFEMVTVNYRPVLIEGNLETSYPSSTTLLVMCVIPTAIFQLNSRIKNRLCRKWLGIFLAAFLIFMVAGRLIAGVHWLTDIVGGALLSGGLVMMYRYFADGTK